MSGTDDTSREGGAELHSLVATDNDSATEAGPWERLKQAGDRKAYASAWLDIQVAMISGVLQAVVVMGPPNRGPFVPLALWPEKTPGSPGLASVTEAAVSERRSVLRRQKVKGPSGKQKRDALAVPLIVDEQLCGVVAMELEHREDESELSDILHKLEWGMAWLETLVRRRSFSPRERLVTVLELVATVLQHEHFQGAAIGAVTEIAGIMRCERVSVGFLRGRHTRVRALSNSASFGKKGNIIAAIEASMDEAIEQQATVNYPPRENGPVQVIRAHQALNQEHGVGAVCTVPMAEGEHFLGALCLERPADDPFDDQDEQLCEHVAALLGPVLDVKRRDDRWLLFKAWDSVKSLVRKLLGPRHTALKLASLLIVAVALFLVFAKGDYRVTADATLEGAVQRVVAAPMAGFVSEAEFRAGDVVSQGQVLAVLDDRDLRLERLKWVSKKAQHQGKHSEAVADHDRAQTRILKAQIEQANAQIRLLDEQLERARIVAPFGGIITAGDLTQSLGAPVERGDVLFELAPLDDYRIILQVDEREIEQVQSGQQAELALAGLPGEPLSMSVETITPVSTAEEGSNYFRVEASLTGDTSKLRPGMEGVGKIYVDRRRLAWIWTHRITQWFRMFIWSWWP